MQKYVGTVNEEERNDILNLFEKRVALKNLGIIISQMDEESCIRFQKDSEEAAQEFNQWWGNMSQKYKFEKDNSGYWSIDFETGQVVLNI